MRKNAFLCGAVCAVLLTGCTTAGTAGNGAGKDNISVSETGEPETEEDIPEESVIDRADFDDDGKDDTVFYERGEGCFNVFVRFDTGKRLVLGTIDCDEAEIADNIMLATIDVNGDGRPDLDFEVTSGDDGVIRRSTKFFVLGEDGEYEELWQEKVSNGETFEVSRQDTRITIKCENADFTDYYWDEVSRIYYNYGIGFGTVSLKLRPVVTGVVTSGDGSLAHVEYSYLLGNRNNGIYIKESVSLKDGSRVIGMELASVNEITDDMVSAGDMGAEYVYQKSDEDKRLENIRDIVNNACGSGYFTVYDDAGSVIIELADYSDSDREKYNDISGQIVREKLAETVVCRELTWPADEVSDMVQTPKEPSDVLRFNSGESEPATTISEALIDGRSCYVLEDNGKLELKTIGEYVSELPYGIPDNIYDIGRLQYVDIDNDGEKECAIIGAFTYTVMLKEYDGKVLMYGITMRGAGKFLTTGLATASSGAYSEAFIRISFSPDGSFNTKAVFYSNDIGLDDGRGYIMADGEGEYEEVPVDEYSEWRENYIKENPVAVQYELTESAVKEMQMH